jgi:hypothetical protein
LTKKAKEKKRNQKKKNQIEINIILIGKKNHKLDLKDKTENHKKLTKKQKKE